MDPVRLGSGDSNEPLPSSPRYNQDQDNQKFESNENIDQEENEAKVNNTSESIEDHEAKLKERIAQCKNIIKSLKLELTEEKAKLEKETKVCEPKGNSVPVPSKPTEAPLNFTSSIYYDVSSSNNILGGIDFDTSMYSACVDSKFNYDENLLEYEKQLEKYQTTLNMAQLEKKNAIRKQMLTKAYKLKLMELENQCNLELLRVKQSLQCLEPLQMIAAKWKQTDVEEQPITSESFEMKPCYLELNFPPRVTEVEAEIEVVKDETPENAD